MGFMQSYWPSDPGWSPVVNLKTESPFYIPQEWRVDVNQKIVGKIVPLEA